MSSSEYSQSYKDIETCELHDRGNLGTESQGPQHVPADYGIRAMWESQRSQHVLDDDDIRAMCQHLLYLYRTLSNDVGRLANDIHAIRKTIGAHEVIEAISTSNNFNMTQTQVRELILNETSDGKPFYPSDIAMEHGLDLEVVVNAVDNLRNEGKLRRQD